MPADDIVVKKLPAGPGREVWVHMVDDPAAVSQQVFEVQLHLRRSRKRFPYATGSELDE